MSAESETPPVAEPEKPTTPTPVSEWVGGEIAPETLPSGNVARLTRPQIFPMIQRGKIPNTLMAAAMKTADQKVLGDSSTEVEPQDAVDFMAWLVCACFVDPKVVIVGDRADRGEVGENEVPPGALTFDKLSDSDITYVISWWHGGMPDLEPFLREQPGASNGGDGGEVQPEAVDAAVDH